MNSNTSTLYLDCSGGISGDMTVAALLDLGADEQVLRDALASLPLTGYRIAISRVKKSAIDTCDFDVILDQDNHDHDMAYLHGEEAAQHTHPHDHHHDHAHHHDHDHDHHHDHAHHHDHGHHHHGRGMKEITQILEAGSLTPGALALAKKIFGIVAEAEAKVHNQPVEQVHFHEVGAVDSIVDIASVAVCLDNLGVDRVIIPRLCEGTGQIRCQHGLLPIPVPATAAIATAWDLPLHILNVEGELVTPTGAAIAAAIMTDRKLPEEFRIRRMGYGAGKRDYATAGFLRAMLLDTAESQPDTHDQVLVMETNIDDCSGEVMGFVMDRLLEAGARDAWYTPIHMKKNRPAYLLSVLCTPEDRQKLEQVIFLHTTTIGIRYRLMERDKLTRRAAKLETPWGTADVKLCTLDGHTFCYPESDSVSRLASSSGLSYSELFARIQVLGLNQNL